MVRRRLAFALVFLFVAVAAQAAGNHQLSISDQMGGVRFDRAPHAGSAMLRGFTPARFERPYVLESDAVRVMLRPAGGRLSAPVAESGGVAYYGAFRGVDVLRSGEAAFEAVFARDRAALESVAYEIVEMRGVIAVVPAANGIRFVTRNPARDVTISAPLLIDASGRPSSGVRWVVSPNGSAGHGTLRLKTNDESLRYPVKAIYSLLKAKRPAMGGDRRELTPILTGTGSITGRVTDAVSGAPIVDEFVSVFDSTGNFVTFGITDGNGNWFTFDGLDSGSYRVFASAANYHAELYNNIPCSGCDFTTGTPVSVVDGATTSGISFALTPTLGTVTGIVTGATAPLDNVTVLFYDNTDNAVSSGTSDANGNYSVLLPGSGSPYKARAFNSTHAGLLDQLYSGIDCGACPLSSGTAITVNDGQTTSGVNFNLNTGGQIAGTVTDTASTPNPIYQAFLQVYDSNGDPVTTAQSDLSGNYTTPGGLEPGTYYVVASAFAHVTELYDNLACASCDPTTGTAVTVAAGQATGNINFSLTPDTVAVSGQVTDANTSAGIPNVIVLIYDSTGTQITSALTDGNGGWSTTLDAGGTYYALTSNSSSSGYIEQLYDDIDCSGCDPTTGTGIVAVAGTSISGIDFALRSNGGSISGTVTDAETNAAIGFASVAIYNSTGGFVTHATADANGVYSSFDELAPGTYYATASASGYATELYSNLSCGAGCDPTTGTAIVVQAGQTTSGINFSLPLPFARITGIVRSAVDNTPISGAAVAIYDGNGTNVGNATTDANGAYTVVLGESGTYYATAVAAGFAMQAWDGHTCNGCDPVTTGDPITGTIGAITPNIDFLLQTNACAGVSLEPPTLPNGTVSQAYSATVSATGATGTVTFAVTSGDLPDGLTLNGSTGAITGTPTAAGTFFSIITATDGNNCNAAREYQIDIAGTDTPTTTVLTASPNPSIYLDPVTLTATVTPEGVSGTVTFFDGATQLGTATLDANGVASIVVTTFNAGTHPVTAVYGGAPTFQGSTSSVVQVVVNKKDPSINWNTPADITYPTALSGTQLNATADVSGTFVYTPAAGTVLGAGTHTLSVTFTPNDTANYNNATSTVPIVVHKGNAVITWMPADYTFGTPLGAAQLNATADIAGTFTYNPPAGTILPAGQQTLSAHFTPTDTANYNEADVTVSLNGAKADPVFSNLSAPTIIIGTASTAIGGKISLGSFIPTGSVSITLNGVTQSAAIQADGTFSSTFSTGSLVPPSYPIAFSYAGDSNFNPASGSSTLTVRYGTTGARISNGNGSSGSTIPFRVTVFNANNVSLASPSLQVTAYGVRLTSSATWLPAQSNGNQGPIFDYQSAQGGSYQFTLKTTGLAAGNYVFGYTIGADTTIYTISFTVK